MSGERFESIWDAIEDTPRDAAHMRLRAEIMMAIQQSIKAHGWTQMQAAKAMDVTQPRVSDLMKGKINLFSLDTLIDLGAAAGLDFGVQVRKVA